jgi:hypothetical protein
MSSELLKQFEVAKAQTHGFDAADNLVRAWRVERFRFVQHKLVGRN